MMSLHPTTCPGRMAVAIGLALALLIAPSANAAHKTDHRFTVWGEIKYEDDAPAAELVVQLLVKDGAPMGESDGCRHRTRLGPAHRTVGECRTQDRPPLHGLGGDQV